MRAFIYFKPMVIKYQALKPFGNNTSYEIYTQLWYMLIAFLENVISLSDIVIQIYIIFCSAVTYYD